jgi:hypothetical protein
MKLIHTVVSADGFRDSTRNPQRLRVLDELLKKATEHDAQLLVVPAGFFAARDQEECDQIVQKASRLAAQASVALIGGVDIGRVDKKSSDTLVARHELPYFGFAVSKSGESSKLWRQVSIRGKHAKLVPDGAIPGEERLIDIAGNSVATLICGELFNERVRESISRRQPDMVIDLGHSGMGQGLIPAMSSVARSSRCPVIHSQHLEDHKKTSIHFVDFVGSKARQHSQRVQENPLVRDNGFWAGWALRDVAPRG